MSPPPRVALEREGFGIPIKQSVTQPTDTVWDTRQQHMHAYQLSFVLIFTQKELAWFERIVSFYQQIDSTYKSLRSIDETPFNIYIFHLLA